MISINNKKSNDADKRKTRLNLRLDDKEVSIRPTPIAFSKHEAGAHQYPYLYG